MKVLKTLITILVTLVSFCAAVYGVLFFLQEDKSSGYVDIYGEDERAY